MNVQSRQRIWGLAIIISLLALFGPLQASEGSSPQNPPIGTASSSPAALPVANGLAMDSRINSEPFESENIRLGLAGASPNASLLDTRTHQLFVALDPYYLLAMDPRNLTVSARINISPLFDPSALTFDAYTGDIFVGSSVSAGVAVVSGSNYSMLAFIANQSIVSGLLF